MSFIVIKDIDRGYGRLRKVLKRANLDVSVGVPDTLHAPEQKPIDEIMAVHEFGLGVPERSFLRHWVDENYEQILNWLEYYSHSGMWTGDLPGALHLFGQFAVDRIRERIWKHIEPELNPETVRRKGTSVPLIDSGQAINSIVHEVKQR